MVMSEVGFSHRIDTQYWIEWLICIHIELNIIIQGFLRLLTFSCTAFAACMLNRVWYGLLNSAGCPEPCFTKFLLHSILLRRYTRTYANTHNFEIEIQISTQIWTRWRNEIFSCKCLIKFNDLNWNCHKRHTFFCEIFFCLYLIENK